MRADATAFRQTYHDSTFGTLAACGSILVPPADAAIQTHVGGTRDVEGAGG